MLVKSIKLLLTPRGRSKNTKKQKSNQETWIAKRELEIKWIREAKITSLVNNWNRNENDKLHVYRLPICWIRHFISRAKQSTWWICSSGTHHVYVDVLYACPWHVLFYALSKWPTDHPINNVFMVVHVFLSTCMCLGRFRQKFLKHFNSFSFSFCLSSTVERCRVCQHDAQFNSSII